MNTDLLPVPQRKLVHIYGKADTGKTTIALCLATEALRHGIMTAYIDFTACLTPEFLMYHKVSEPHPAEFLTFFPMTQQQGLEFVPPLLRAGVGLIVLDGVGASPFTDPETVSMRDGWASWLPMLAASKATVLTLMTIRDTLSNRQMLEAPPDQDNPFVQNSHAVIRLRREHGAPHAHFTRWMSGEEYHGHVRVPSPYVEQPQEHRP